MAMVGVDSGSLYRRIYSLSHLAWSWVGGRLAPFYIHQMNRVNSRNGWCHDDTDHKHCLGIIIINTRIIKMAIERSRCRHPFTHYVVGQEEPIKRYLKYVCD